MHNRSYWRSDEAKKPQSDEGLFSTATLFAFIGLYDLVLVDVLEYVWRVHEDADGAGRGDREEDEQLQPVDHHGNVLPVLAHLCVAAQFKTELLFFNLQDAIT